MNLSELSKSDQSRVNEMIKRARVLEQNPSAKALEEMKSMVSELEGIRNKYLPKNKKSIEFFLNI